MKPRRYLNFNLEINPELHNALLYFLNIDAGIKANSSVYELKIAIYTDLMGWYES